MARVGILVFHEVGHVNPTVRMAKQLRARGHEVVYLGFPLIQRYVESQGFTFEPLGFEYVPEGALEPRRPSGAGGAS